MGSQATVTALSIEHGHPIGIDTPVPRFSWQMADVRPGAAQRSYRIQVASGPAFSDAKVIWDSGEVTRSNSVLVPYAGPSLSSHTRYHVRVAIQDHHEQWTDWSESLRFETAYLSGEWEASWIAGPEEESPRSEEGRPGDVHPAPYVRKEIDVPAAALEGATVRLSVACRGLAEVFINGRRVGEDVLAPGWTDYNLRCQYITYDVTDYLVPGTNVIGAILGDGWYSGRIARLRDGERRFGSTPQLLLELRAASGLLAVSDGSWRWAYGPIIRSDIYDGEVYDARKELAGWNEPGTSDAEWKPVRVVGPARASWNGNISETPPMLDAKVVPPVRRVREIVPVAITQPDSRHIYDLGQNITGWARIAVAGKAGQTITVRFAEMLQEDGSLYTENLRSALATDSYTFAADGEITWEPRFTFHGFRYVELSGIHIEPDSKQVTGVVLHNDLEETGRFSCSSELINQLQSNIQWGQRGNYLEAPTDCPQRDERLGWTGVVGRGDYLSVDHLPALRRPAHPGRSLRLHASVYRFHGATQPWAHPLRRVCHAVGRVRRLGEHGRARGKSVRGNAEGSHWNRVLRPQHGAASPHGDSPGEAGRRSHAGGSPQAHRAGLPG